MSLNQLRSLLYTLARFLGDVQAVRRHRVVRRWRRRALGRLASRLLR